MRRKDIVIGFIVLMVLALVFFFLRRPEELTITDLERLQEKETQIEDRFNIDIPDDLEKATLEDVSGGISEGIATREYENGKFIHTVLAGLPDLGVGEFYQSWLIKDDQYISTGKMKMAKGGYILGFESSIDYSAYNKVLITQEKIFDSTPEITVLEGAF